MDCEDGHMKNKGKPMMTGEWIFVKFTERAYRLFARYAQNGSTATPAMLRLRRSEIPNHLSRPLVQADPSQRLATW